MTPPEKWEWFGGAGHFICGRWCRFHLCTKVGKYLVSTVGEYVPPSASAGSEAAEMAWLRKHWPGEDIGFARKYETMVFLAGARCSAAKCGCKMPATSGHELDFEGYNKPGDAAAGHMAMCLKWARKR